MRGRIVKKKKGKVKRDCSGRTMAERTELKENIKNEKRREEDKEEEYGRMKAYLWMLEMNTVFSVSFSCLPYYSAKNYTLDLFFHPSFR